MFNQMYKRLINVFPFADINLTVSEDKVNQIANNATNKLNASLVELRRLFLVENMLDSVKFGLSLWVLTYIGSWFNAMTLILMSWVGLFTIPKVKKEAQCENYIFFLPVRFYVKLILKDVGVQKLPFLQFQRL